MKAGVIFCAFNAEDLLEDSLSPWVEARSQEVGGNQFCIVAVSIPFEKFEEPRADDTLEGLRGYLDAGKIDRLIASDRPMKETEARGKALSYLVEKQCDITIMVDSDEIYTTEEIERILEFVEERPATTCFKGSLKNYVFNGRTYLAQPFNPMRIHRVRRGTYVADSFWDDNNILYRGTLTRDFKRDVDFPCLVIPKAVAWVKHFSWLNDQRSKKKVEYQTSRSWICSFDWDDSRGGLIWRSGHEQEVLHE